MDVGVILKFVEMLFTALPKLVEWIMDLVAKRHAGKPDEQKLAGEECPHAAAVKMYDGVIAACEAAKAKHVAALAPSEPAA